jgi:hypothetical protein
MKADKRKYKRSAGKLLEEYDAPVEEKRSASPKKRSLSPSKKRDRNSFSPTKTEKKIKDDAGLTIDSNGAIVLD